MKPFSYVILNPTGNLTALVTEWGGAEDGTVTEVSITRYRSHRERKSGLTAGLFSVLSGLLPGGHK